LVLGLPWPLRKQDSVRARALRFSGRGGCGRHQHRDSGRGCRYYGRGDVSVAQQFLDGAGCWEDPLPDPFTRGMGVLAAEGFGQGDGACCQADVGIVLGLDHRKMRAQAFDERSRKNGSAVLAAFASTDHDLTAVQVEVRAGGNATSTGLAMSAARLT